jgi:hypothetical protein
MTFTLDEETAARLRLAAERMSIPKSQVVREAIRDYSERVGRLSERERLRLLAAFDELVPKIPRRPLAEVEREIREIREARRGGGRKTRGRS